MDAISKFFEAIGDAIIAGFDFLISFFGDLVYAIQLLGKVVISLPSYFSWLPPSISSLLITLLGIAVIYKILGREG